MSAGGTPESPSPVSVTIRDLTVRFSAGAPPAVDRVTLSIEPGELFMLLGPSGCGKTTLLRAIAGFATPEPRAGRSEPTILFGDEDVTALPAHARNAGMVFQSFALWPHMTVFENVAFGLREKRVPKGEIAGRVAAALESTRMGGKGPRRVDELSGGEQQRVALARALVVRPRCLLLDEPLSNLDARLRHQMRDEIRRLCKAHGLTTIYVTHDQKEALAVGDRIAVMDHGRVLQVGTPREIYDRPRARAVAAFVGETNLLRGRVVDASGWLIRVETAVGPIAAARDTAFAPAAGSDVWVSIRPEHWRAGEGVGGATTLRGRLDEIVYLGEIVERRVRVKETTLAFVELAPRVRGGAVGEIVTSHVEPADVVLLPLEAGNTPAPVPSKGGQ
ncbi:MAG TPA: ABC transporter ATP-binding protein [Polyangia bacterium]|nr:ABC transporter ATP-binding protein [Polyangia bacterium]